jgi:hypothetical protein
LIVKGTPTSGGQRLGDHISRTDTNERMEVKELRGVAAEDFHAALLEMEAVGSGSRTKRPFYHASINTQAGERLTDAQRFKAIDRLEAELGLTGQPRAVVVHEKKDRNRNDREHCHVVWLRVDAETMTAIRADHNYRKHEIVARELERAFGHERVQGAHIERDGKPRPERTPSHKEHQQAERTGIKPQAAREHITALWQRTDSGASFQAALEQSGWTLAKGDRRDFVVIDPKGEAHSLARRVAGATAKDVRARMADIDMKKLPSVAEGRAIQYARHGKPEPVKAPSRRRAPSQGTARAPSHATQRQPIRVIGSVARPAAGAARVARRSTGGLLKGAGKLAGGIANVFESLLGGAPTPPKGGAEGSAKDDNRIPLDPGKVPPKDEIDKAQRLDHEQRSARHAKYLQKFSREVPDEVQRDADIEHDKKGRERTRGE